MRYKTRILGASLALGVMGAMAAPALAGEQDAIDGCIDRLREVGGPDARGGGEVVRSTFSEAATEVILRDSGGTSWRCIAYSDGTVADLNAIGGADDGGGAMDGYEDERYADDGEGAMAGAYGENDGGYTATQEIRFASGRSSAEFSDGLTPGSSTRWTLRARSGQDLTVIVNSEGPGIYFQVFNPDGTMLQDQIPAGSEYGGELWQNGEHVVEVINRGNQNVSYTLWVGID